MRDRLKGKVAIVTGGGQGIGAGVAKAFAAEGAAVAVAARSVDRIENVCRTIDEAGGRSLAVPTDIRDAEQVQALVEQTVGTFGRLDILVNNAGIAWYGYDVTAPTEEALPAFDDIMQTNVRGSWLSIHYSIRHMIHGGGGSIIQIGSVHGTLGAASGSAYSASKGALDAMTRALAVELAPHGVRVNNCNPGAIEVGKSSLWHRLKEAGEDEDARRLEESTQEVRRYLQPLRIVGMPEDIAACCVYLASDESKYVTGTSIMVDGGSTAFLGEPPRMDPRAIGAWQAHQELEAELRALLSDGSEDR